MSRKIKDFVALGVMAAGAGALFLSVLILKGKMGADDYGAFAGLVSLIVIIGSVGILSYEQTLLRVAQLGQPNFGLTDANFYCALVIIFVTSIGGAYLFVGFFYEGATVWKVFLICMFISYFLYGSSIARLGGRYVESQLVSSLWKCVFVLFSFGGQWLEKVTYSDVESAVLVSCVIGYCGSSLFKARKGSTVGKGGGKGDLGCSPIKQLALTMTYFFSVLIIVAINNFDRFYIDGLLGKEELGEYFFLATIYVYPFLLVSNFIGLRLLVDFKSNFSFVFLVGKIKAVLYSLIPVVLLYSGGVFIFRIYAGGGVWDDPLLVLVFVAMCVVRCVYAVVSAAAGAVGSSRNITMSNLFFLLFVVVFVVFAHEYIESTVMVVATALVFLLARCSAYIVSLRFEENV